MYNHQPAGALRTIAQTLSDVFSPILVSTYTIFVALWLTRYDFVSLGARLLTLGSVFVLTAFLPALGIFILIRAGKVSDTAISDRRQRFVPFAITALCSLAAYFVVRHIGFPPTVAYFLLAACVVAVLESLISFFWKISAHTGALGALVAYIYYFVSNNLMVTDGICVLCGAILLTGAIGWARLYLNRHTPGQVFAGALLGAAVVVVIHACI